MPVPGVPSFWLDSLSGAELAARPPLAGDTETDVVIVGGGYTGLWTAYYLRVFDPGLRVLVVDGMQAGFGASGRNGGWCTAEMPSGLMTMIRRHGLKAALQLFRAGRKSLDEIERVTVEEGIDCHWRKDGALYLARTGPQEDRLRAWHEARRMMGITGLKLLTPADVSERIDATGVRAAGYTPHCAAIHPARLARGLATVVERRGATIAEHTRALDLRPGLVRTDHGTVRARFVVCATEAYTGRLPGHRRRIVPLYSHMIATEPLAPELVAKLGWRDRMTVADSHYRYAYLQRTADDRIVVGGRSIGYHLGSRTDRRFDRDEQVRGLLQSSLVELFPALSGVRVSHHWGGAFGLHRDALPVVVHDENTGLAHVGGYGGEGIALSNLAGRSLAALLTKADRPEATLCWTNHRARRWEPEPLRFIGVRGLSGLAGSADRFEDRTGRPARLRGRLAVRATV
ncbi:MAG TPA: FAD-dependent oxidoreductase [Rugosimonospora sp.]|nr:FAD-dependent oxidoreductase [Rugosimonospora sp.]